MSEVRTLTEGGIFKPLVRLAMPIMATGFIQMAYTLVDLAWIGRLGSKEMAAVGAMGIVAWLISSVGLLTKIGAEISIAQAVGARQNDRARVYASHNTTVSLIIGIGLSLLLALFAKQVIALFSLEADVADIALGYLRILCISMPTVFLTFTFSGIYNGIGRTNIPFYFLSAGLIANMVLDPLFIFGIKGIAAWGVDGAATATAISQTLVLVLFVWKLKRRDGILDRFPFVVSLRRAYTWRIFRLGVPIAAMNSLFAAINFYMARVASEYGGHLGVMSQTTGAQIEAITWNTAQGFATALGAFAAQNYGAGKLDRIFAGYRYTMMMMVSIGLAVAPVFYLFGEELFSIFVTEKAAQIAGAGYLRIESISQVFMMVEITTMGLWNGFGRTTPPAVISITGNMARIPLAVLLASQTGVNGVWWAITISCIVKGIASPLWFGLDRRR